MLLFLHAWRHTVIVLLAIPTSLVSTFLVMYALGFSLNIMSLMALALMIGILVDDSIVVLENIHRHLQLGENPQQAALTGRGEIGMAAIAITMADVVVYTPIAFISGSLGQLFRQYGLTVVAATLFSLLISFTLTPMLASRWLSHTTHKTSNSPRRALRPLVGRRLRGASARRRPHGAGRDPRALAGRRWSVSASWPARSRWCRWASSAASTRPRKTTTCSRST